jgi:YidC/Oxa1 family membrane protein insertase
MGTWSAFLDLLQAVLGTATQAFGGNLGAGIIAVSLTLRVFLLPLTYPMARASQRRAALLEQMQPELKRLRERFGKDPSRLMSEHKAVFRKHGLSLLDGRSLLGALVQTPIVLGMYTAVRHALTSAAGGRFLWIQNITRPDALLALLVATMTYAMMQLSPQLQTGGSRLLVVVPTILTFLILMKLGAGFGLYWGASTLVGTVQNLMLRRARAAG